MIVRVTFDRRLVNRLFRLASGFFGSFCGTVRGPIVVLALMLGSASLVKAAEIVVPAGGDLQAAMNNAQCGDTIVVAANGTFTAPTDGFVARTKCAGSSITVSTSGLTNLPAGKRVEMSDAPNMAKIVTHGPYPVLTFASASQGWKFIGIEITTTPILDYAH